jgi:hypothetical protein
MSYAVEVSPVGTVGNLDSLARASRGIRWHVFHARTSYERQADLVLRRLGMETFLPLRLERWHGADRYIVAGLPGYTFARFDNNAVEWGRDAISRQGCGDVGRFLMSPTTRMPANIPDAPVDAIRRQCAGDGVIYPDDWREGADGLMLPPRSGDRRKQVFDGFAALKAHIDALVTTEARRRSAVELVA